MLRAMVALVILSVLALGIVVGFAVYTIRTIRDTYRETNGLLAGQVTQANGRADQAYGAGQENVRVLSDSIRTSIEGIVDVIGKNAMGPMPLGDTTAVEDAPDFAGFGLGEEEDWTTEFLDVPPPDRSEVPVIAPGMGIPGIQVPNLVGEHL